MESIVGNSTVMKKEKFQIEYPMKSVPVALLWNYISSARSLEQWFADRVRVEGKRYFFSWNGQEQPAMLLGMRNEVSIRFRWEDDESRSYFEMKISVNELTDETLLTITDFSDPSDMEESQELWNAQIEALRRIIGC